MLRRTFCHLPGLGPKAEQRLWAGGIQSWEHFTDAEPILGTRRVAELARALADSQSSLDERDAAYFAARLPSGEVWRLYREFQDSVAYVDLETTGLGGPGDHITTAAVYDGRSIRHYVHGRNLAELPRDLADYRVLVTYNGKCFDLPMLRRAFGLPFEQAHIDLRYVLASLGLKGGLKSCERQLGFDRGDLADVDGFFAVVLWQDYVQHGNPHALDTLLAYNIRDVVQLEPLLVEACHRKMQGMPFATSERLPARPAPEEPFRAHGPTLERLRRRWGMPGF